jgi:hypothetical protein
MGFTIGPGWAITGAWAIGDTGGGGPPASYPTWNPTSVTSQYGAFSNGNLTFIDTTIGGSWFAAQPTKFSSTGKFYFECTVSIVSGSLDTTVGIMSTPPSSNFYIEQTASGYQGYGYGAPGTKLTNDTSSAFGSAYSTTSIIGVAVDIDAGKVWFALNGTWQASGNPATGANPAFNIVTGRSYGFAAQNNSSTSSNSMTGNWGQNAFAYTPPLGFIAQTA